MSYVTILVCQSQKLLIIYQDFIDLKGKWEKYGLEYLITSLCV